MSGLKKVVGKIFGGKKRAAAPGEGPGSEALTGLDPMRAAGLPTSAATGQGRRARGAGSGIGGAKGRLGANTVLSRTY